MDFTKWVKLMITKNCLEFNLQPLGRQQMMLPLSLHTCFLKGVRRIPSGLSPFDICVHTCKRLENVALLSSRKYGT